MRYAIRTGLLLVLALAGCSGKQSDRAATNAGAMGPRPGPQVSVQVSTEPRHRPRLTLGPGVLTRPRPTPQQAGGLRVTADACTLAGSPLISTNLEPPIRSVARLGSKLYLVDHRHALRRYDVAPGPGCRLTPDKTFGTDGVLQTKLHLERLSSDGRDLVVASSYLGSVAIRGGKVAYTCRLKDQGHVALHPSGRWGLAAFAGSDTQKIAYGPRSCGGITWYLTHLKDDARRKGPFRLVSAVVFQGETAVLGGSLAIRVQGWHPKAVIGFDRLGRRRFQLGALVGHGSERFGWIKALAPCGKGHLCVLDSGARRLTRWSTAGKLVGAVSLSALLGMAKPAATDLTVTSSGTGFLTAARGRATAGGKKWLAEGSVFRIRGLCESVP